MCEVLVREIDSNDWYLIHNSSIEYM